MLAWPSQTVALPVSPGDTVTVTITQQSGDSWLITMSNDTSTKTFSTNVSYASTLSSAEWIVEAPSAGRGVLPIDDFGTVSFFHGAAVRDGTSLTIAAAGAPPVTMINGLRQPPAHPSVIRSD